MSKSYKNIKLLKLWTIYKVITFHNFCKNVMKLYHTDDHLKEFITKCRWRYTTYKKAVFVTACFWYDSDGPKLSTISPSRCVVYDSKVISTSLQGGSILQSWLTGQFYCIDWVFQVKDVCCIFWRYPVWLTDFVKLCFFWIQAQLLQWRCSWQRRMLLGSLTSPVDPSMVSLTCLVDEICIRCWGWCLVDLSVG